jgi:hypothetical protein
MKKIILTASLLVFTLISFGQAQEGSVEYKRKLYPAAVIELPYSESVINSAMSDFLSKKGKSKISDLRGFTTYRNTDEIAKDSSNADLYFKVERKSRREKEVASISLLLISPNDDSSKENVHYLNMEQAKTYLNELSLTIESYSLENLIKEQNEEIIQAEAKLVNMAGEIADLEQKKMSLEQKIMDNKKDHDNQQKELRKLKKTLAESVAKRTS